MEYHKLIVCHECDLLFRKPSSVRGRRASCSRCGASLPALPGAGLPLDWTCAVTLAALIAFCIAQSFPLIELRANGMTSEATLFGAGRSLWSGDMRVVAAMVFCSSILFPLIELLALRYLLAATPGDVMEGLRGQLRTGNLLTGQLYVALDMFPKAPRETVDVHGNPIELPTVPNTLDELQVQIADIARKLNQVPFDRIGANLNGALENANRLFGHMDTEVVPQARDTLAAAQKTFSTAESTLRQTAPMQSDIQDAMQELTRTLQSLNTLADYLERHPQALLFGKKGDRP